MTETAPEGSSKREQPPFVDDASEGGGWRQMAAAPLLADLISGGIVIGSTGNTAGLALGMMLAVLGLIAGILIANRVLEECGTLEYMSRVIAGPELDRSDPENLLHPTNTPRKST